MSWARTSSFRLMPNKTVCSLAVGRRKRTLLFCIAPQGKKVGAGCPANSANPSIARWLGSRTDAPYADRDLCLAQWTKSALLKTASDKIWDDEIRFSSPSRSASGRGRDRQTRACSGWERQEMKNWFEVDRQGLARLLERKGKEFILFELIQNGWDEPGVTKVSVSRR